MVFQKLSVVIVLMLFLQNPKIASMQLKISQSKIHNSSLIRVKLSDGYTAINKTKFYLILFVYLTKYLNPDLKIKDLEEFDLSQVSLKEFKQYIKSINNLADSKLNKI
jgi:hypothetical protein